MTATELPPKALRALHTLRDGLDELIEALGPQRGKGPDRIDPADPRNKREDGKLSPQGVECLYRMFDEGIKPPTAAARMGISDIAAYYRLERYHKMGGKGRSPLEGFRGVL